MQPGDFDYDSSLPLDLQEHGVEERDGARIRDVSFDNALGERVAAYFIEPLDAGDAHSRPGVLWAHWLETHAEDSNRTQFVEEALTLARSGVVSILPDCFWSCTPESFKENPVLWWEGEFEHDKALSVRQVVELRRALDVLLAHEDVDPARTAFVGHDFGGMYGLLMSAVDQRPGAYAVMAVNPHISEWFLIGPRHEGDALFDFIDRFGAYDPINFVGDLAPTPIYFQFAHFDFYVPKRVAAQFYRAASEPKRIGWYDGGHGMHENSREDRLEWLKEKLGL